MSVDIIHHRYKARKPKVDIDLLLAYTDAFSMTRYSYIQNCKTQYKGVLVEKEIRKKTDIIMSRKFLFDHEIEYEDGTGGIDYVTIDNIISWTSPIFAKNKIPNGWVKNVVERECADFLVNYIDKMIQMHLI
jgi:hypothetical protein